MSEKEVKVKERTGDEDGRRSGESSEDEKRKIDESKDDEIKEEKLDEELKSNESEEELRKEDENEKSRRSTSEDTESIDNFEKEEKEVDEGLKDDETRKGPAKPPRMKDFKNSEEKDSNSENSSSETVKVPGEPGPEEFHEIPIDIPTEAPTKENRRITFDLSDPDASGSSKSSFKKPYEDDSEEQKFYEKSKLEKFLNYIFCRKDLVNTKLSEKPVKFWDLFKYGNRMDVFLVVLALCLASFCGICQPIFAILSGRLANTLLLMDALSPEFFNEGTEIVVLFVVIGAGLCLLAFAQFCCFNIACTRITRRIRNAYLKSILRQNAAWFEKNHSGALNTKLNDNIERIYEGIGDKLGLLTRNGVQYITGIIVAFITNWQMTLPLLLFSPLIAFLMSVSSRKITKASRKEMEVYAGAGAIAEEAITAYRTVAAFNAQEVEVRRYHNELMKGLKAGLRKGMYSGGLTGMLFALVMVFMGAALLWGSFLYSIGVVKTPGDIFVVMMAIMSGAYHLGTASPHLMVLLTARVAASTVYKTIERVPKIDPYSPDGRKIYDLKGRIEFKNVSFRYPTRPEEKVLKNFSFTVNPGQTVALVGSSGSGKSTVVGILNRLYEFEQGIVTIDGTGLKDLNVHWLRTVIGTVQQEPIIFNDTVEANIKRGNTTLSERDIVEACKMANAHEFIENLPEGYGTRIGDGGVQLSGGQKQRLAIARTLARNPKILLLDEATSALDTHSEALVQSALNNASKNRTTIVIAHRLSTIKDADRIIVMHKGRFVESGSHNELLRRKGAYWRLVKAQELDMTEDKESVEDTENNSPEEILSPDGTVPPGPLNALTLSKEVRESIRQSFQRDFMLSKHLGDPEQQELEIEVHKEGVKPASFGQIFLDNKDLWPNLFLALAVCLFNSMAMPMNALLYGKSFEMFKDGKKNNVGEAAFFLIFFFGLGVIAFVASTLTMYLFGKIGETVTMNMRVRAFRSIISQDGYYFDNPAHTPGKLISRLATDTPNVKAAMDTRMGRVVQGILSLITAIIISLFIDWVYALTCSVIFIILGSFQFFVAKIAHSKAVKFAQSDEAGRIAIEAIENVRTIQLLTSEMEVQEIFEESALKRQKVEILKAPIEALNFATTHGLQYFTLAFTYMVGIIFVTNGLIDRISLFQVAQTMYFGAISVMQATEFFPEFVKSRLAASLMYNIINKQPKVGETDTGERITIDGKDLKLLSLKDVRQQMSLVEQQPRLFTGTIKENIAYGLDIEKISMDEIVEAAKVANAA
ncbi:hypothetical protein FO519_008121, partial [Halicephalobus sp. NKZ332]